jgi:hypothetical protein
VIEINRKAKREKRLGEFAFRIDIIQKYGKRSAD